MGVKWDLHCINLLEWQLAEYFVIPKIMLDMYV